MDWTAGWGRSGMTLRKGLDEKMVGTTGFEPATSCSQSKCSTRLSYVPTIAGDTIVGYSTNGNGYFICFRIEVRLHRCD